MWGSVSCALTPWPALACWLYDHAWLSAFLVHLAPMALFLWLYYRRDRHE